MDEPKDVVLSALDRATLANILNRMPYGGAVLKHWPGGGQTGPSLIANLQDLRETLKDVSDRDNKNSQELLQLRRDVEGMRRLFGTFRE